MEISQCNSNKFKWLSFLAICCVVFGHSFVTGGAFFEVAMPILAQWHVPWFYFLSGMLLYYSLTKHSSGIVLLKKVKGLLIPYVIWAGLAFIASGRIIGQNVDCNVIFGISTPFPSGNPHLWFLHALISFTFVSIVLWICTCRIDAQLRPWMFMALYVGVFVFALYKHSSTLYGTPSSPFYFLIGFMSSQYLLRSTSVGSKRLLFLSFCAVLIVAIVLRLCWFVLGLSGVYEMILRMCCVLSQMSALWLGCDLMLGTSYECNMPQYLEPIFFVYCFHGLILEWMKKWWIVYWGNSPVSGNIGVLTLSLSAICLSLIIANSCRKSMPRVYNILTGGR